MLFSLHLNQNNPRQGDLRICISDSELFATSKSAAEEEEEEGAGKYPSPYFQDTKIPIPHLLRNLLCTRSYYLYSLRDKKFLRKILKYKYYNH